MSGLTQRAQGMQPDIVEAVRTVRSHLGVAELADYGIFEIAGPDAPRFLQNRLSNDVLALKAGEGHMNAVLDRQAKIQGVFSLHQMEDDRFFAIVEKKALENAVAQILKYRIVENVNVVDISADRTVFTVQGPQATALIQQAGAEPITTEFGWCDTNLWGIGTRLVKRSLTGEDGYVALVSQADSEAFQARLTEAAEHHEGVSMAPEVLDILRVEAGLPKFGVDYDTETLLPETGLERIAASYSKGCYLGQETVARVKTYGTLPQALSGLLFSEKLPGRSDIFSNGKKVGFLTSVVESPTIGSPIGMAYLGKAERVPGRELTLEINGKPYSATVKLLPFHDAHEKQKTGKQLLDEGLKHYSEGFDDEAMRLLRQALAKQPDLVEAYEALGVILSRHEQYDEAIGLMQRILELDPDHVMAHTNLSVFYMKQEAPGWKERAEEEKAKATMAAFKKKAKESGLALPDPEEARRKQEQALLERIAMFEEALKFNPDDPLGNFGLASAYLELKRYEEAIEPFRKTIKAQPKHSVAFLSLGKSLEGAKRPEEAKEAYQKGVEVAAAKGDLMPLREMQSRLDALT